MSTRTSRVEALLQREIAGALLRGEVKDPRVGDTAAISVTGVRVSPDLSSARVFVDVMGEGVKIGRVLDGLNAGSGVLRALVGKAVRLRRVPSLRFEQDESIERGRSIEQVLEEIHAEDAERNE